jgi:hypothetical protein
MCENDVSGGRHLMWHRDVPGRRPGTVSRSRPGFIGRRSGRTGTEPMTARSALGLRLLLSCAALPVFAAGTSLFALWAASSGPHDSPSSTVLEGLAIACGVIVVLTLIDLTVILRGRSQERHSQERR